MLFLENEPKYGMPINKPLKCGVCPSIGVLDTWYIPVICIPHKVHTLPPPIPT